MGTRGLRFPANLTLNQLPASTLALGDALRAQVDNPFYPQIASGILALPKVSRAQLLRPYPQFDGVTAAASNCAPSNYHALQVKLEKRFSRGLTFLSSYTYSKLMDISTGPFNGESLGGGNIQDNNNLRAAHFLRRALRLHARRRHLPAQGHTAARAPGAPVPHRGLQHLQQAGIRAT